jgi:phage gpG-like protein
VATSLRVEVTGGAQLAALLRQLERPQVNRAYSAALTEMAMLTARIAATDKIIRGGRTGKGRAKTDAPAHPSKLTSRTGRLRASLAGSGYREGLATAGLPRYIEVGTDVAYAPVHEFGGTVSQSVPAHTRSSAFGRPTQPYRVRAFTRRATYPARPFLGPALEDASKRFETILVHHLERQLDRAGV